MAIRIVLLIAAVLVYIFVILMAIRDDYFHKEQLKQFQMIHVTHIGVCFKCKTCYQCDLPIGVKIKYDFAQEF